MKKICLFFFAVLFSFGAISAELSKESIQGSWRILTLGDMVDEDEDYWEFNDDKFVQNLEGLRLTPDKFEIKGQIIDLGYAKIKVIEFDGSTMKADMAGFIYTLKKK